MRDGYARYYNNQPRLQPYRKVIILHGLFCILVDNKIEKKIGFSMLLQKLKQCERGGYYGASWHNRSIIMLTIATDVEANACYVYVDPNSQNKSLIRVKMPHIYTSVSRFDLKLPTKKFNHEPGVPCANYYSSGVHVHTSSDHVLPAGVNSSFLRVLLLPEWIY